MQLSGVFVVRENITVEVVFRPEFLSKQVAVKLHLTIPLIFMVILHKYRIPMRYFGSFFVRKIFAISAFPECRIKGCH